MLRNTFHGIFSGFYFKNCNLGREIESYANTALTAIMDKAPYDASVSAVIEKQGDLYRGYIEIYSRVGSFLVNVSGTDSKTIIDQLAEKMHRKIELWRSKRYFMGLTRTPLLTQ